MNTDVSEGPGPVAGLDSLDDPVRRRLYEYVASCDEPAARDDAAAAVGISRAHAAYHLDELANAGILSVSYALPASRSGPGAGRPAKRYSRTRQELSVSVPPCNHGLLAKLLADAMAIDDSKTVRSAPAGKAGRDSAGDNGVINASCACGYESVQMADGGIELRNCPVDRLAGQHTELVRELARQLVQGMLEAVGEPPQRAVLAPRDGRCRVVVRALERRRKNPLRRTPKQEDIGGPCEVARDDHQQSVIHVPKAEVKGTQLNHDELKAPVVLETRNLHKSFGRGATVTPVLTNIDMRISRGEFVALIGPSGSGKSTLLSILGLLDLPTSGDVLVNGQSVAQLSRRQLAAVRGRTIGYVFQSFNLLAGLSVAENVMLPGLLAGKSGRAQYDRAITLLDQVGLASLAKRVPAELSGGEQQRVAVARALFMTPDVILADEPTGNLDTNNGRKVIDALSSLNSSGQTIVLVTHDRSIADDAPRLISLLDGQIETDSGPVQPCGEYLLDGSNLT